MTHVQTVLGPLATPDNRCHLHAVLVGIVLALALPRDDDSAPNPREGFGSVLSTPGKAYLFEPSNGKVGLLDASRNTLKVIGRLQPEVDEPVAVDPLIAKTSGGLWLVHKPGAITRFDLETRRASGAVDLSTSVEAPSPSTTRIVRSGDSVIAVSEVADGYALSRITAATGAEQEAQVVPSNGSITGFVSNDESVWILTSSVATQIDAQTLQVEARLDLPPMSSQAPRGAAVTNGALWTLGGNGSTLVRVDLATQRVTVALQILPSETSIVRGPASVVAGDGRVWVMVQRTNDPKDHSVRIAGVNAATGKPTKGADLPTELFIAAIAVT